MRAVMTKIFALLLVLVSWGCGDDADDSAVDLYPELSEAQPLDLSTVDFGVGIEPGSARGISLYRPEFYGDVTATFPNAMVRVQTYDEAAQTVGEYRVMTPPNDLDEYRGPGDFREPNVAAGRFEARVGDVINETEIAAMESSTSNFETHSIILETWRLKRDWHVRWDGTFSGEGNNVGKGNYGFFRPDYRDSLLDQIESVAATHQPRYFIVGTELERLFRSDDGPGIAPGEYANFILFYREAAARIKAASPDTQVGSGVNWDRFATRVAPAYGNPETMSQDEILDRAFTRFMLPLIESGDIVALKTYRGPVDGEDDDPTAYYQFLRRIPDLYEIDAPIVFYDVGAPVDSSVEYSLQLTMMNEFVEWNAGVPVEFVAWRNALNYDGTDTNDQSIQARCAALTDPAGDVRMPIERCFDGLLNSVFTKKGVYDLFEAAAQ